MTLEWSRLAAVICLSLIILDSCRRPDDESKSDIRVIPDDLKTGPEQSGGDPDSFDAEENLRDAKDLVFLDAPGIPQIGINPQQKEGSIEEWKDIVDSRATEEFLLEGKLLWGRTKAKVKTLLRLGEDARRVLFLCEISHGGRRIKAQLKIPQQNYHEWKGELNAYRIGKKIGLKLPPVVLRNFSRKEIERLWNPIDPEDLELISWSGKTGGSVLGSLRYWVESLNPRKIGGRVADEEYLMEIAQSLHPANLDELLEHHLLYLDLGRAFIFDYLIYNNDRARNLGTLALPDGGEKLILFDHGLAFGIEGKKNKKNSFFYFDTMQIMPADIIDNLKALTKEELLELVGSGVEKKSDLKDKVILQIWERRTAIIEKSDKLVEKYGPLALY